MKKRSETAPLSARNKANINKLNIQQVLAEFSPSTSFDVKHTHGDEETDEKINLTFRQMKDFSPEHVARQVPRLQAMLTMRNLLRDLGPISLTMPASAVNCWKFCVTPT